MSSNPTCFLPAACDTIRFMIISTDQTTRSALVEIRGRPYGCGLGDLPGTDLGGTVAEVCDPAGCFFNEPPEQLMGREGWARYMMPVLPSPCSPYAYPILPEWEVFSLCCAERDCVF